MLDYKQMVIERNKDNWTKWRFGDTVEKLPEALIPQPIKYACPVCEKLYDKEIDAMDCRDMPYDDAGLKVGDIVIIPNSSAYRGPAEGFEHWSAFFIEGDKTETSHFEHHGQWFPYYVVTGIHPEDRGRHRCVVTVMTLYGGALSGGWNLANGDGHHAMFHPGRPRSEQHSDTGSTWWEMVRNGERMGKRFASAQPCATLLEEAKELGQLGISASGDLLQ